jgi:hypothetical protein
LVRLFQSQQHFFYRGKLLVISGGYLNISRDLSGKFGWPDRLQGCRDLPRRRIGLATDKRAAGAVLGYRPARSRHFLRPSAGRYVAQTDRRFIPQ